MPFFGIAFGLNADHDNVIGLERVWVVVFIDSVMVSCPVVLNNFTYNSLG